MILLTADQGAWALTEFEHKLKKQYSEQITIIHLLFI